jgi:hypothetical protein
VLPEDWCGEFKAANDPDQRPGENQ